MHFKSLLLAASFLGALATAACTAKEKSPPPAGVVCGERGAVSTPALLTRFHAGSMDACAARCLELNTCKSSAFGGGICHLYKKSAESMGFKKASKSPYFYSDRSCFALVCPTATTTTATTTTLTNTATATDPNTLPTCISGVRFKPGGVNIGGGTKLATFCDTAFAIMQNDGNFVIYPGTDGGPGYQSNTYAGVCNGCAAVFTADGTFQIYNFDGTVVYDTNTEGQGALITFNQDVPYLVITDANGNVVFSS